MCKYNLNSSQDAKKFLLKNHPDKTNDEIPEITKIIECYKDNIFCKNTTKNTSKNTTKNKENLSNKGITKKRGHIFRCMRKKANFSKINMLHKFDNLNFNHEKFNSDLNDASPKLIQLLNNIKNLDKLDKKNYGHTFKHFIFSDVKEGGYGAKIIASALIANGYNNIIKARKISKQKNLKLYLDYANSQKNFGLLSSNTIFNNNVGEILKKNLLKLFNERPGNIHGQKLRFIIFDSGFKEGIDLFDVKYVHIFEPSITIADLKQTVGRATRTCGQKGLDFIPGIGWPLYVYNYYLTVPEISRETLTASKLLLENTKKTKDIQDKNILLFKNSEKFNDTTMLYSEFDKAMINLSKQLYELAPIFAVDFYLTNNLHNIEDLNENIMDDKYYLMGGTKAFKKTNKNTKYYNIELINCQGNCGKKTTLDVPVDLNFLKQVYYKYSHPRQNLPKKNLREYFCDYMQNSSNAEIYCRQLNHEWALRYIHVPEIIEKNKKINLIKEKLKDLQLEFNNENSETDNVEYKNIDYKGINSNKSKTFVPKNKLNFNNMRDFIKSNYNNSQYKWDPITIENKCIQKTNTNDIELNPTQNFITKFFSPESPYKGILLWHSVGTGKTCSGVSIASSTFERAGYTILWITRTTLKSDIWKNIFDQICHSIILDEVKKGLLIPENITERKKLLSKNWLEPMSYKQFSNLLSGKNKTYDQLININGKTDILKKTLIIIDEAHKLYGGDLKAAEKPNTNIMEELIMNSYKVSGENSCKLLIMSATPFTNSPLELFSLLNLFMTDDSDKVTTDKEKFKKEYMTSENILSQQAVIKFANKYSGYISYLNREKDATQFAQPIMINVPVLMTTVEEKMRDYVYLNKKVDNLNEISRIIKLNLEKSIKNTKALYKKSREEYKIFKENVKEKCSKEKDKSSIKKCIDEHNDEDKKMMELIKNLLEKIKNLETNLLYTNNNSEKDKTEISLLKEKLKKIKKSLILEYVLFNKCQHLKYKSFIDKNNRQKTFTKNPNKKTISQKIKTV
tara:strand:- start:1601 stop:4666 length:3066 start_codon:yes stop_codon:yes gene_type:complete